MSRKHRMFFIALWLIAATLFSSASAQETKKSGPEQAPATQSSTTSRTNAEQEIVAPLYTLYHNLRETQT